MKVNHVLILAAGKGTRMGEIGKILPKVIWPVFEKTILELEVAYAQRLYPEAKIHINLYHNREATLQYIKDNSKAFKDVNILIEREELDVGGAVHNMAQEVNYEGNLLILNSDQFLLCEKKILDNAVEKLREYDSVMFLYDVKKEDGYNEVINEQNIFCGIRKNAEIIDDDFQTYTGMSLIKLSSLNLKKGKSSFFESVINSSETKTFCQNIANLEYWDFGTVNRYHDSMFKLLSLNNSKDQFINFLKETGALEDSKVVCCNNYDSNSGIELKRFELNISREEIEYKGIKIKVNS